LDAIQERFKPTEVLIPLPSAHQDHRYAYEVCIAATRPSASKWRPSLIAAYEYPASGWGDGSGVDAGHGGIYVDVSRHWHKKMAALDCYQSQMRGPQHLFSLEGAEALAIMRGLECGFKKAELFHALRILI
jgi:LmbE family N-acetylglucosaminyl deacetylase